MVLFLVAWRELISTLGSPSKLGISASEGNFWNVLATDNMGVSEEIVGLEISGDIGITGCDIKGDGGVVGR